MTVTDTTREPDAERLSDDADAATAATDASGSEPDAAPDALFAVLWDRALAAWDEDGPHRALLEHALRAQTLPDLAGRYRALEKDPDKGPRARKQIDRIVAAATQLMFATKTPPRTKTPTSWTVSAALVCVFVLGWMAYAIVRRH
jgi:hypothetical protein